MDWLPSFLNAPAGALAAAIAVPALLALYFLKLRRQPLVISSTLLWRKTIQDLQVNAPFQRLRRNLLLLLQLLAIAALCLALARPVSTYVPPAGKSNVIILDRSASMSASDLEGGRTRLEEARRRAREVVDALPRGGVAMVIAADDSAEIVQPFTTDARLLRRAIDAVAPTDRPTDLRLAYQLAEAQTNFDPQQLRPSAEPPDVWLFSDGKARRSDELAVRGRLRYTPIGAPASRNIAIVTLSARRNYERPGDVQIFARLANFGDAPEKVDLELSRRDGEAWPVVGVAAVSLVPASWDAARLEQESIQSVRDSVEFTIGLSEAAELRLAHKAAPDALAADDVAHVVVPPPNPLSLLLVSEGNWYLETQLLPVLRLARWQTIPPAEYERAAPDDFDILLFDRGYSPRRLPPAGGFIFFGGVPSVPGVATETDDAGGERFVENVAVLDWQREHPLLRGLSLRQLFIAEARRLRRPASSDEILAEAAHGPLIQLHRTGRQTHLVLAFDLLNSNWPLRESFPVFLYSAIEFLAASSDLAVREPLRAGEAVTIPRVALHQMGAPPARVELVGAGQRRGIDVPATGELALPPPLRVGLYRTAPPIPQHEWIAVNLLDELESDLAPIPLPPGGVGETVGAAASRARVELWWWLVAAGVIPLLLIEWWVYTRRVHL